MLSNLHGVKLKIWVSLYIFSPFPFFLSSLFCDSSQLQMKSRHFQSSSVSAHTRENPSTSSQKSEWTTRCWGFCYWRTTMGPSCQPSSQNAIWMLPESPSRYWVSGSVVRGSSRWPGELWRTLSSPLVSLPWPPPLNTLSPVVHDELLVSSSWLPSFLHSSQFLSLCINFVRAPSGSLHHNHLSRLLFSLSLSSTYVSLT